MSLAQDGRMTLAEVKSSAGYYPSEERMKKGPVAIAECVEEIPCNPCESACRFGAIRIGECITNIPQIEEDKCIGCGVCIANCSGMAIFVMDKSYSDEVGTVAFPYEYQGCPSADETVNAVDRAGKIVCRGTIKKTVMPKSFDRTCVVTVEVPIEMVEIVRGIEVFEKEGGGNA